MQELTAARPWADGPEPTTTWTDTEFALLGKRLYELYLWRWPREWHSGVPDSWRKALHVLNVPFGNVDKALMRLMVTPREYPPNLSEFMSMCGYSLDRARAHRAFASLPAPPRVTPEAHEENMRAAWKALGRESTGGHHAP